MRCCNWAETETVKTKNPSKYIENNYYIYIYICCDSQFIHFLFSNCYHKFAIPLGIYVKLLIYFWG